MKSPVINFVPYTAAKPLHSLRSLRDFARRIKTRALRARQQGCVVSALAAISSWSLPVHEPKRRARHARGGTVPVRVIIGAGPPDDVYDECQSGAKFCTDPRCPEWYREVRP